MRDRDIATLIDALFGESMLLQLFHDHLLLFLQVTYFLIKPIYVRVPPDLAL